MSAIGPELPPHLLAKRKRKQEQEAEQTTAEASGANTSSRSLSAEKRRRVIGPATPTESANTKNEEVHSKSFGAIMPPAPLEERSSRAAEAELSESEDSDDFGPALPTDNLAAGASEIKEASNGQSSTSPAPAAKKLERDEWMMIPPKQDNLAANMDPSKIRARGFQTGKGAKGPVSSKDDDSAWFETPEQKQKRLRDEMMGFTQPASSALQKSSRSARSATDEAATAKRKDEIEKSRGPSLMEQHKQSKGAETEDDPSQRAFDRDKDMACGMRITSTQRSEMLKKSSGFSSRFSGGSYL